MRWLKQVRFFVLFCLLFVSVEVCAQSARFDFGPLPISLSPEQFVSLTSLTPSPLSSPVPASSRHRRPAPVPSALTAQQVQYREAVLALGRDDHHLVHVELASGKVRTGAIIAIHERDFELRDGILDSKHIFYSQLKDQPRHVPAVGTHLANGFKWVGFVTFVVIFFIPLAAAGGIPDC